ncbi:MAG TPA: hypothetical protein VF870_04970 [Ignavibacteriaceae bacterium]
MKIDTSILRTIPNFGKMKGLSRQRIHILLKDKRFDTLEIDGVKFIILNNKALKFKAQK